MQQNNKQKIQGNFKHPYLSILLLFMLVCLSACGEVNIFGSKDKEADLSLPIRQLLTKGMKSFNEGDYYTALKHFDKILDMDPFSPEATLAELKAADSHFFRKEYEEAKLLYEEFEERHPTNEAISYVMYQKAMCSYKQIKRIDQDISSAQDAIRGFTQLLTAYPNSPFTDEARARIRAAKEFLVNHEFFVVKFYLKQKKYSQAEVRLKYIISTYPNSTYTPQAKEILEAIQAGNPPTNSFFSWLPEIALPDWLTFSDNTPKESVQRQ